MKYRDYDQIYEELSQQPRMKQSTANKIIFIIILIAVLPFLLVSMLFMGIGIMANHNMNKDKKVCTERVMGIVCALDEDRRVDYDSDGDRTESVTYAPVFAYSYNGRDYRFLAEGQDENLLKELMSYQNDKDVKASLLNTYIYSIVRNGIPEKTTFVSTSRMEKVIYAYVDAQQKLRQQKRVSARGVLWGMLKDYLFTSEEKAHMDKTIPKDMQERMFMGIFGAVGGSGPTNFDMLSPAQQAVIHESSNGR